MDHNLLHHTKRDQLDFFYRDAPDTIADIYEAISGSVGRNMVRYNRLEEYPSGGQPLGLAASNSGITGLPGRFLWIKQRELC